MPRTLPPLRGNERLWRDLLPSGQALRRSGRYIYMFRNTKTNQILYTLKPKIEQSTLKQLPFIGKHSVPARIRADVWTAHCRVGPFPSTLQGLDAFRKLRDLRKLHELCWNKNNPEWAKETKRVLIRKIMDQKANTSADLARVLAQQMELGEKQSSQARARQAEQDTYLKEKWSDLKTHYRLFNKGRVQELEQSMQDKQAELAKAIESNKEAEATRLNRFITEARREIKYTTWAHKVVAQARERTIAYQKELQKLQEKRQKKAVATKVEAIAAEVEAVKRKHAPIHQDWVRELLLPRRLKSLDSHHEPFSVQGIEAQWQDLYDAERAESWPKYVRHSLLPTSQERITPTMILTEDEIREAAVQRQMEEYLADFKRKGLHANEDGGARTTEELGDANYAQKLREERELLEETDKRGLSKWVPAWFRKPFSRSEATV